MLLLSNMSNEKAFIMYAYVQQLNTKGLKLLLTHVYRHIH